MCGRFSQTATLAQLKERFGFKTAPPSLTPRYNLAPSQDAPVIINDHEKSLQLFHWGLIPSWAKDKSIGYKMINARAETVVEKPSYRKPFQKTRCLVIADGFYEWKKDEEAGIKIPMRITLQSKLPFAMAGLWDTWKGPEREIRSFTIITTAANSTMSPIHDRMPLILTPEQEDAWIDPGTPVERLKQMLVPYAKTDLQTYSISALVNSPKNDTPDVIKPVPS